MAFRFLPNLCLENNSNSFFRWDKSSGLSSLETSACTTDL